MIRNHWGMRCERQGTDERDSKHGCAKAPGVRKGLESGEKNSASKAPSKGAIHPRVSMPDDSVALSIFM